MRFVAAEDPEAVALRAELAGRAFEVHSFPTKHLSF
jgi:hypothetical protein